jgi:hypothetical protein
LDKKRKADSFEALAFPSSCKTPCESKNIDDGDKVCLRFEIQALGTVQQAQYCSRNKQRSLFQNLRINCE